MTRSGVRASVSATSLGREVRTVHAEIYEHPRTRFAASFLGDANFLRGRAEGDAVVVDGLGPVQTIASLGSGDTTLAVRPDKMRLAMPDESHDGNRIEGTVTQRVFSGTSVTYILATPAGPFRTFE